MTDVALEALLNTLRRADQIEDGLEDMPLDQRAVLECQALGWLDKEMLVTAVGREVLDANPDKIQD